jgi:hypothetical protein
MQTISDVALHFCLSVGLGTYLFNYLADTQKTGGGLQKVLIGVSSSSLAVAFFLDLYLHSLSLRFLGYLLCLSCLAVSYAHFHKSDQRTKLTHGLFFLFILCGLFLLFFLPTERSLSFAYSLLSTLFIGAVHYIMLLGHWYLVTPKMSVSPLLRGMQFIAVFLFLKIALSFYGVTQAEGYFTPQTFLGEGYSFNWMMLLARFGAGYLGLLIVGVLGWKLTKMRDTQAATGTFYVMVIFLFIGELFSGYFFFKHGLLI